MPPPPKDGRRARALLTHHNERDQLRLEMEPCAPPSTPMVWQLLVWRTSRPCPVVGASRQCTCAVSPSRHSCTNNPTQNYGSRSEPQRETQSTKPPRPVTTNSGSRVRKKTGIEISDSKAEPHKLKKNRKTRNRYSAKRPTLRNGTTSYVRPMDPSYTPYDGILPEKLRNYDRNF